jgi:succinoglycan biosynthesis protein ExoL
MKANSTVRAFSFRREGYNKDFVPPWKNISLGSVEDGRYLGRMFHLARAVRTLFLNRRLIRESRFLYAVGFDQALLAWCGRLLSCKKVPLVYEVADINKVMVRADLVGIAARFVERMILARCHTLVVTSPGFSRSYFAAIQGYHEKGFLWENRLYTPMIPARTGVVGTVTPRRSGGRRWVIGYFGLLRCARSFSVFSTLLEALPESVTVLLRGVVSADVQPKLDALLETKKNVLYRGPYRNPDDLEEMYSQVDFAWGFELIDTKHNSRWLLPNRVYEAGYYQVPTLAPSMFQVGDFVEVNGIGWAVAEPYDIQLIRLLQELTIEEYRRTQAGMGRLPEKLFAGDDDGAKLCQRFAVSGVDS